VCKNFIVRNRTFTANHLVGLARGKPINLSWNSRSLSRDLNVGARSSGSESMRIERVPGQNHQELESEIVKMEIATFGAGCFWGVEAAFREAEGVVSTRVGYAGGWFDNPTYQDVCSGRTGHAESVEVTYDSTKVSYDQLLSLFWEIHNPTILNRQGPDIGTQYRSVIFFRNSQEEAAARASRESLQKSGKYSHDIVTEITPASRFWEAEDYHQQYFEKRGISHCLV